MYSQKFIYNFDVPGRTPTGITAGTHGRVFVGQRQEGFAVNLGEIFDLVNLRVSALGVTTPAGAADLTGAANQAGHNASSVKAGSGRDAEPARCSDVLHRAGERHGRSDAQHRRRL